MIVSVDDFTREVDCVYANESYSVRDNGAVLRHPRAGKRLRPNDNKWTFGKENSSKPYLHLSNVPIHRIVATAFHGDPPDPEYVVDHIDTNCRNNRPENLRWLSRLDNTLKNPATRKKIEYLCGSIEAFLENPSMLNDLQGDPNFRWMRAVTPEEAENCKVRMSIWADSESKSKKSTSVTNRDNSFARRVYQPLQKWEVGLDGEPGLELSLTARCAQYMWRAPAYFPLCPKEFGSDPVGDYFNNIQVGDVLAYSDSDDLFPVLSVVEARMTKEKSSIVVMCNRPDNKLLIVGIELHERSKHFIHFGIGFFSSKDEASKAFYAKNEMTDFWLEGYTNFGI